MENEDLLMQLAEVDHDEESEGLPNSEVDEPISKRSCMRSYSVAQKAEIVRLYHIEHAIKGRGAMSAISRKYKVNKQNLSKWIKQDIVPTNANAHSRKQKKNNANGDQELFALRFVNDRYKCKTGKLTITKKQKLQESYVRNGLPTRGRK
jgi:transposase-like protein